MVKGRRNSCMKHSLELYFQNSNLKAVANRSFKPGVVDFVGECKTGVLASAYHIVTSMLRENESSHDE